MNGLVRVVLSCSIAQIVLIEANTVSADLSCKQLPTDPDAVHRGIRGSARLRGTALFRSSSRSSDVFTVRSLVAFALLGVDCSRLCCGALPCGFDFLE